MRAAKFQLKSSIGRKLVTGVSGIALMGFIVAHLAGNLTLLGGSEAFNTYAYRLHSLGELVILMELGLVAIALGHVVSAVNVRLSQRSARPAGYAVAASKGKPSQKSFASMSMLFTGGVLLIFLILHVWAFRFGPGESAGYITTIDGHQTRDLHRLVVETFKQLPIVVFYVAVMLLLGLHLRHGFWSAFQSLGALNPKLRPVAQIAGIVFAVVMAVGFLLLPIYIYLYAPVPAAAGGHA